MVPISTLRETIVLVIFGIVLVPIAAKRAQDAPGYWKAFAANAQSLAGPMEGFERCASHSSTRPQRNETTSVNPINIGSRLEAKGRLTLRMRVSKPNPAGRAAMAQTVAEADTAKVSTRVVPTAVDGAFPPAVPTTSAANRERWTLIWMGTAIAVVAVFMSFC